MLGEKKGRKTNCGVWTQSQKKKKWGCIWKIKIRRVYLLGRKKGVESEQKQCLICDATREGHVAKTVNNTRRVLSACSPSFHVTNLIEFFFWSRNKLNLWNDLQSCTEIVKLIFEFDKFYLFVHIYNRVIFFMFTNFIYLCQQFNLFKKNVNNSIVKMIKIWH